MTSKYLDKPLRDLCPVCKARPAKQETEVCQACEDDAQDGVVYLDEERALRVVERLYAGDEI